MFDFGVPLMLSSGESNGSWIESDYHRKWKDGDRNRQRDLREGKRSWRVMGFEFELGH